MKRDEALRILITQRPNLDRFGVQDLWLFGSVARDEAGPDSDVDVLVEFRQSVSLFDIFRLQHYLEETLGVPKVDLVIRGSIRQALRERVLAEAIHAA
jgi:predicted nucleotidyltransferase